MTWRLRVDREACIGSGMCAGAVPEAFDLDADGKSRPVREEINPDQDVLDAAVSCPVEAIAVLGRDGEEIPWD
ncbi:ferredoxin [Longispora albida]|uniref:ferredoxin n=1 Tax=Longispora albida TaxID=203523 RepID=UPI000476FA25|nr:ferredoxin [Longispora albida]